MTNRIRPLAGIPALALALGACQDLTVTNPNRPDAERATAQPLTTESFVATSFRTFFPVAGHGSYPSWAFSTMALDVTSGFADFGQLELSAFPRTAWNNSPVNVRRQVNENPWYAFYRTSSAATDVVKGVDRGLVIVDAPRTARAKAMGKFMQGLSHGHLGLIYDKAVIVDEKVNLDTVKTPTFSPYRDVVAAGIAQIDAAIAVANSQPAITYPVEAWLFQGLTRDQFVRLANSMVARLMVYAPRTRAERAAVNWNEVIRRVDAGIQADFTPVAQLDILVDDWKRLLARLRTTGRPSDFGRPSYWLVGPADSTNGYVNWLNTPIDNRQPFQIRTRDRRIQGTTGPASPGKYMGYNLNNLFAVSRGTWRFSHYYYLRYGTGTTWQTGPQPAVTVAEMDLIKAEALIRLGRAAEAVPLINKTRVANGELPPVTVDGPPDQPGCVPRKASGACGSLWDALRYEKLIELVGVNGIVSYFDARGWQTLPQDTPIHFPIPGRELATLQLPNYTFGGPGGQGSAPAPDPERCPVAGLARCPQ
ncbi:MAG: hypothetical protein KJT01_04485 [Gemmatimonadetes bacterium]|nr:hypothetical protein [Gemmatimonadota bacterium]